MSCSYTEAGEETAEDEFSSQFVGVDANAEGVAAVHGADDERSYELNTGGQRNVDRRPEPKTHAHSQ